MNTDKAGREMDTLVAERVMELPGIEWGYCRFDPECSGIYIDSDQDPTGSTYDAGLHPIWVAHCMCDIQEPDDKMIGKHSVYCHKPVPFYSTDIAASFEVDKPEWRWTFAEHPQRLTILLWGESSRDGPIATAHVKWDEAEMKAQAYALGRCRAALKAVRDADD